MFRVRPTWFAWLALLVACLGCNNEKVSQFVDKSQNAIEQGIDKASETVAEQKDKVTQAVTSVAPKAAVEPKPTGTLKFTTLAVTSNGCYAELIPASTNRPAFLQVRSYETPESESIPLVFMQGKVDAGNEADLTNKTIEMQMFVQLQKDGPILKASMTAPVLLTVSSVQGKTLNANIAGDLRAMDGSLQSAAGSLIGILP